MPAFIAFSGNRGDHIQVEGDLAAAVAAMSPAARVSGMAQLTQVSPVAWQHINLCGRYEFTKEPETINLEAIIQALAEVQITPEEFAATP